MGSTLARKAAREVVDALIQEDKAWYAVLSEIQHRIANNFYPQWEIDMFFQHWQGGRFDLYDAYSFAQLHSEMCSGKIAVVRIAVDETPYPDKSQSQNNNVLKNIGYPFAATFTGKHHSESDGCFQWRDDLLLTVPAKDPYTTLISPGDASLEVGYQSIHKTVFCLHEPNIMINGVVMSALARWPYHYKDIFLIIRSDAGFKRLSENQERYHKSKMCQMEMFSYFCEQSFS